MLNEKALEAATSSVFITAGSVRIIIQAYLDALPPQEVTDEIDPFALFIFQKAEHARIKAQIKFPQPNYVTLKVAEEAGEVVQAAVHYAEGRATWEQVEGEVVQTIAMLMRLLIEGDQVNGVIPPSLQAALNPITKTDEGDK